MSILILLCNIYFWFIFYWNLSYLLISWRLTRYNEIWRRVTNLSLMSIVLKMSIEDQEEWVMVFSIDDSYLTVSTSFSLNLL